MSEICEKCGLPKELCVCKEIAREKQQITVKVVERRYGKKVTVVSGFDKKAVNLKEIAKELKSKLACGGTVKDDEIELQGNHKDKIKDVLAKLGFSKDSVVVE